MSQEIHKCPICGHEWLHGKSGEHDCTKRLLERINYLKTMVDGNEATIRGYEEQDKAQRATITILETLVNEKNKEAISSNMVLIDEIELDLLRRDAAAWASK